MKKRITIGILSVLCAALLCFGIAACGKTAAVTGIKITKAPDKVNYVVGEKFDPTGMEVSAVREDSTTTVLKAEEYTYAPSGALTVADKVITITYTAGEKTFTAERKITVSNPVKSVEIKSMPTKTQYVLGEHFDPTGMKITVTYTDDTTAEINVADENSGVSYKTDSLTAEDAKFELKVGGYTFTIDLTFGTGIFIEAETGIIEAENYQINDDAVKDGKQTASGGLYVGNMFAGESITFKFEAKTAGKADIAFILASLYLKRDNNWTPIEMGDCQFNKIVEFTVNGIKYDIPDSVILPGGVAEDQEKGDLTLWFNWKEVVFEGSNAIKPPFIPHDYTDTSQSSFSGSFTANIDCLRVTSDVECAPQTYDFAVTDSSVAKTGDDVILTVTGTAQGYDKSSFDITLGGTDYALDTFELNEETHAFTATMNLAKVTAGSYDTITMKADTNVVTLTTTSAGGTFEDALSQYTVGKSAEGNLTIEVVGGMMYSIAKVELKLVDGKPCYVITGSVNGYTKEDFSLDFQENETWAGNNAEFEMTIDTATKTYTVTADLSFLKASANVYIPHFKLKTETASGAGDIKAANVEADLTQTATVNGNTYALSTEAFECVCVKITAAAEA